jgi:hypothetical protein
MGALTGYRCESEPSTVDHVGHCQCRERNQGKRDSNIEVQNEIVEVEIPRFCAVKSRATFRASEDIVFNDVPRDDGKFAVCKGIYADDWNL